MNTNLKKLSVILGTITALAGTITAIVAIPGIGCKVGWNSAECIVPKREVELITRTETGESLPGVKILFTGKGAPEEVRTDDHGYAKVQITSKGDVQVNLSKPGYPVQNLTLNLENDPSTVRIFQFDKSGQPTVNTSPPITNTTIGTAPVFNPSISESPSSTNPTPTVLGITKIWHNVTFQLDFCTRKQNNVVSCQFTLTSTQDIIFGIVLNNSTKIVDGSNNTYYADKGYVGKAVVGANDKLSVSLVKDAYSKVIIDFADVPNSVSKAFLLNLLLTWYGANIQFRNLPIN